MKICPPASYRRLAAGLCAWLALTHAGARADTSEPAVPPEVKARCAAFLQRIVTAQRKGLDGRMATEIGDVAKATGLDQKGIETLQQAAIAAEDAAQADLLAKGLELYAKAYAQNNGSGLDNLERPELVEAFARPNSGFDQGIPYTRSLDQPAWRDALAQVLTPAQAALWQKFLDDKIGAALKEFDALLDKQADQVRATVSGPILTRGAEIVDGLGLTGGRVDVLNGLVKKAVDASVDAWRQNARKSFLDADEEARRWLLNTASPQLFLPSDENAPEKQAVWTEGLTRLLTDDDRAKLQSAHGRERERRTHALAMVMLSLMDEKVAFTAAQRPRLEPVMERLVQHTDEFYPQHGTNPDTFNLQPTAFYKAASTANPEELRPILDAAQWNRWQQAAGDKHPDNPREEEEEDDDDESAAPVPDGKSTPAIEEPEDLERLVSDYLQEKIEAQHRELNTAMLLQAEDAARVADLPPEVAARLRTAALGAAEIALAGWSSSVEQSVRAQAQGATRETLKQRLGNSGRNYYGQIQSREQPLWKQAVRSSLTQAQQDAWQKERDARARYADEAIAQWLLAEFDRLFSLGADQWERLAPLVLQAVHDYRPDINRLFAYNSPNWFLTSYYMFLPLHAIPPADCQAVIGKERYDRWAESNSFRFSAQYWDNLRDAHARRTKEEKP